VLPASAGIPDRGFDAVDIATTIHRERVTSTSNRLDIDFG
jgi:hypothetical protein